MFFALALTILTGCEPIDDSGNPLESVDARYTEILREVAIADRDTTRNHTNKEARRQKIAAEQKRVAFFNAPGVIKDIEAARTSSDPGLAAKGEAYWRSAVFIRSWTEAEKGLETDLLAHFTYSL